VLDQTWLGGNTISDLLIASAMLFHVSSFRPECCMRYNLRLMCHANITVEPAQE